MNVLLIYYPLRGEKRDFTFFFFIIVGDSTTGFHAARASHLSRKGEEMRGSPLRQASTDSNPPGA